MSEFDVSKSVGNSELNEAQVQEIAGGTMCSAADLTAITASLIEAYENLVGFTSHVIGRVAGEP